jgi:tetratricopeptide (TPR) repeat protein
MANDNNKTEKPEVTPNYQQILYTPQRVEKWLKGEINLQQLTAISGPEMLQMAIIGFSMYEQGRYNEAKMIFQGLVSLDPKESYFLTALGAVHLAEDDLEGAKKYLDASIKVNPKEIAAFVNRGEVNLRQGNVLEAAQDFTKAVELDPQGKDPLTTRAKVLAAAALETIEAAQKEQQAKTK